MGIPSSGPGQTVTIAADGSGPGRPVRRAGPGIAALVVGHDLTVRSWNQASARLFGWTGRGEGGHDLREILVADPGPGVGTAVPAPGTGATPAWPSALDDARRGVRWAGEVVAATAASGPVPLWLTFEPLSDAAGAVVGVLVTATDPTERRRRELDLLRLAAVVDSSPDAILSKTPDGVITSWNRAAERLYGYSPAEAVGAHVSMLVPDDRRAELADILETLRQGHSVTRLETVRIDRYGTRLDVALSAAPLTDEDGRIVGASTLAHDITERRRVEADLRRLAAVVDASPDAILTKTPEGIITSWNPAASRLYGYGPAEAVGAHVSMLVPADRHAELDRILATVMAGSPIDGLETRRRRADGTEFPVRITAQPLIGADGRIVGASTVTRDLSETVAATTARADAELRFEAAFRRSAFGMAVTDTDGVATSVNPAMCALLGRPESELLGRPLTRFCEPLDAHLLGAGVAALRHGDTSAGADCRFVRPDGTQVWVHTSLTAMTEEDTPPRWLMVQMQDITDRTRVEEQLLHRALHDDLTGLPNRALLNDRLAQSLAAGRRSGARTGVVFLDLDGFKHLNDVLGHAVGDRILVEVSRRLTSAVRADDTVARFGGDEFVLVYNDVSVEATVGLAARLSDAMARPFAIDGREESLGASLGITVSRPGSTDQTLLSEADAAMYQAKELGRGRTIVFDDSMRTRAEAMLKGERALRAGITGREVVAHFQPVLELASGIPRGVEALARWHTADGRVLPPDDFIPMAESSGLVVELGEQVLAQAATVVAGWNAASPGAVPLWVSVNLSARQLVDTALVGRVAGILQRSGLPASLLHLEITETVVMQDVDQSIGILEDLRSLGVHLAVDDFGTGYSSLAYLQQLPVDTIKIDRSFVSRLDDDTLDDRSIVDAIISLADALHLDCVAEGVETESQEAALVALGCRFAQGYRWCRPLPPAEAGAWAGQRRTAAGV